jgi:hypothetical protein
MKIIRADMLYCRIVVQRLTDIGQSVRKLRIKMYLLREVLITLVRFS